MEKLFRRKPTGKPIDDPVIHSREKTGYDCTLLRSDVPWEREETYYTTRDFDRTDRSYHKHCGPTAITNLLLTLARRRGLDELKAKPPEELFAAVAAIGRRRFTYWNIRDDVPLGGTSYVLLMGYVHACLRHFGLGRTKLSGRLAATPREMARELRKGSLLILSLYHHRYYGSHIVVACGVAEVRVPGRAAPRLYLKVADGWVRRPRYIAAEDLPRGGYVAVHLQ